MNRADILKEAEKCICGEREQDYGTPEDNFATIGHFWSVYLRAAKPNLNMALNELSPKDVAVMMSLLKVARIATGTSIDSFIDLAGYAACAGEVASPPTYRNENTCVVCGKSIPEGTHICPAHTSKEE